jgi:hypothetical protein
VGSRVRTGGSCGCDRAAGGTPLTHEFLWGEEPEPPRARWPVNAALSELGVSTADAVDGFDALGLGRHRMTDKWLGDDRPAGA